MDPVEAARKFDAAMERLEQQRHVDVTPLAAALYQVETAFTDTGISAHDAILAVASAATTAKDA